MRLFIVKKITQGLHETCMSLGGSGECIVEFLRQCCLCCVFADIFSDVMMLCTFGQRARSMFLIGFPEMQTLSSCTFFGRRGLASRKWIGMASPLGSLRSTKCVSLHEAHGMGHQEGQPSYLWREQPLHVVKPRCRGLLAMLQLCETPSKSQAI